MVAQAKIAYRCDEAILHDVDQGNHRFVGKVHFLDFLIRR